MEVHYSSKSNEWATPQNLFDELNDEFNFTLDPCATDENAKCSKYFTVEDDGLSKNWSNEVVFMNPPYGREIKKWIKKAYEESLNGATVVCLIPARTDTMYWHDFIFDKADDIRFLRGRLKFGGSKNSAPFPSAIVVYLGVTMCR
ncbi:phage N-6-adenine-methyltransferase [Staphylococcus haemolyticus]|nr:phage N-6-adenine-methyltransferase [Staphylococcus haemolyticus]MDR5622667.1 phage N-6-adenine-methyltransferase [Staphylococcus haemolyticus]